MEITNNHKTNSTHSKQSVAEATTLKHATDPPKDALGTPRNHPRISEGAPEPLQRPLSEMDATVTCFIQKYTTKSKAGWVLRLSKDFHNPKKYV